MSVFAKVSDTANRLTGGVQQSVRRARLEGERRVLQRQHRAALEELGRRVVALAQAGGPADERVSPEMATIEAKEMEIEAKSSEIDALNRVEAAAEHPQ
jgi:hypothetical protein